MKTITRLILLLLTISSCTVYKEFPIDIYRPGAAAIPKNTQNIALIYRNFKYSNDTLQHYYKSDNQLKKAKSDPKNMDSLLVASCLNELASNLKNTNPEAQIHVFPTVFKVHKGAKIPALDFDVVNRIGNDVKADIIISLETYSYFYSEYSAEPGEPKPREVITANVWAVYDRAKQKITDRKTIIDTIFWNALDDAGKVQKNLKLPNRLAALKIASELAGGNYAKRFVPSWQKTIRIYAVPPPPDFESAEKFVQKNDWDSAIAIWKKYADLKKGKIAVSACYNLAFGYEMKDDIDAAIQWLNAAKHAATEYRSHDEMKRIDQYMLVLVQRKKDIERLNSE